MDKRKKTGKKKDTDKGPGTTAAAADHRGRWPQWRREVAELCDVLGPRQQQGEFSLPNLSLPLDAFPRLAGLVFLLVAYVLTVCPGF